MPRPPALLGIHHLTAITADASANHAFFTRTLGMRLVKKTVNQDDTSAYHLFYADGVGTPGSDITFFDWPAPRETRGTNAVTRTALRVPPGTLPSWSARLAAHAIHIDRRDVDGREVLDFEDTEGQRLRLVEDGAGQASPHHVSPVPAGEQIIGLGTPELSVADPARSIPFLERVLGLTERRSFVDQGEPVRVFATDAGEGTAAELHLRHRAGPSARQGAGAVHHVAFRMADDAYDAWVEHYRELGVPSSGPVDRYYFRSLYAREPSGILIELATDGPGFAADEPQETMGQTLALPPFLEPKRASIERGLKPLI